MNENFAIRERELGLTTADIYQIAQSVGWTQLPDVPMTSLLGIGGDRWTVDEIRWSFNSDEIKQECIEMLKTVLSRHIDDTESVFCILTGHGHGGIDVSVGSMHYHGLDFHPYWEYRLTPMQRKEMRIVLKK